MKRPIALTFVVVLTFIFLVFYVAGFVAYLIQHFHQKEMLGSLIFLICGFYIIRLPFDLLKLRHRSWLPALGFWGIIGFFGVITVLLCSGPNTDIDFGSDHYFPGYVGVAIGLLVVIVSTQSLWILMRRDVRELFQQKINSPTPPLSM